ncbi:MAG TPA: class II aldolase/adducin family protein [Gammaproteobacteria bacterium]|nr:class II aldolase/adducin family protein [Gammaproteobacteria bacterium]
MSIKQDLTIAYKALAHLKYDDHTYTHLSARDINNKNSFFIYPFGLRFEEVEPNNLMKISLDGIILEGEEYQYNRTGYVLHGAIYDKRPDIQAIFHLHTPESLAVSALTEGLLPLSQWALHFYDRLTYHNYDSLVLEGNQGSCLLNDLGQQFVILLRNHGFIACGRTIQEAMFYSYHLQKACETQCLILSMNKEYIIPSKEVCEKAVHDLLTFEKNLGERDWQAWKRLVLRVTKK